MDINNTNSYKFEVIIISCVTLFFVIEFEVISCADFHFSVKADSSMSADAAILSICGLLVAGSPKASSYPVLPTHAHVVLYGVYAMTVQAALATNSSPFHAKHTGINFLPGHVNLSMRVSLPAQVTLRSGAMEQLAEIEYGCPFFLHITLPFWGLMS